jgi:hypothetical protein
VNGKPTLCHAQSKCRCGSTLHNHTDTRPPGNNRTAHAVTSPRPVSVDPIPPHCTGEDRVANHRVGRAVALAVAGGGGGGDELILPAGAPLPADVVAKSPVAKHAAERPRPVAVGTGTTFVAGLQLPTSAQPWALVRSACFIGDPRCPRASCPSPSPSPPAAPTPRPSSRWPRDQQVKEKNRVSCSEDDRRRRRSEGVGPPPRAGPRQKRSGPAAYVLVVKSQD